MQMVKEGHTLHFKVTQKMMNETEKVTSYTFLLEPVMEINASKMTLKIVETEEKTMEKDIGTRLQEIGDIIEVTFGKKNVQGKLDVEEEKEDEEKKDEELEDNDLPTPEDEK